MAAVVAVGVEPLSRADVVAVARAGARVVVALDQRVIEERAVPADLAKEFVG